MEEYYGSREQLLWEGEQFFCEECESGRQHLEMVAGKRGVDPTSLTCCEVANVVE